MRNKKTLYLFVTIISLILFLIGVLYTSESKNTDSILKDYGKEESDLIAHWKEGNVVALIRHAERCDRSDNECLDEDSGITISGKNMSIKLGNDFRSLLNLEDTTIYNSPVKRASQTAKYMFGESSKDQKWLLGGKDCRVNLLKDILHYKEDRKNMILITHSECINNLSSPEGDNLIQLDSDVKKIYNLAVFLVVDKRAKRAHALGYLSPDEWAQAISQRRVSN